MLLACLGSREATADDAALWRALRTPGHVAIMRHAVAPGTGDPAGFKLGDCGTQRNLSDAGRKQARRIGARFRAQGIRGAEVYSSQWCRCLDTAALLDLGPVKALPALNSFFSNAESGDGQVKALRQWLADRQGPGLAILVTHQVNITALTGIYPGSGEIVVFRAMDGAAAKVLGTIRSD